MYVCAVMYDDLPCPGQIKSKATPRSNTIPFDKGTVPPKQVKLLAPFVGTPIIRFSPRNT